MSIIFRQSTIKKKTAAVFILLAVFFAAQIVYAGCSDYASFTLHSDDNWVWKTTAGNHLRALKETNSSKYTVQANVMTMWCDPSFRIVNSNNQSRSGTVSIKETGTVFQGSDNIGIRNYYYYASVKPSSWQVGTDKIKLRFNPK